MITQDFDCDICGKLCEEVHTVDEGNTFICSDCQEEKMSEHEIPKDATPTKTKEDKLKEELFYLRRDYNERLDHIINSGANNTYKTWEERQQAIDDCLNVLRKRLWERIADFE